MKKILKIGAMITAVLLVVALVVTSLDAAISTKTYSRQSVNGGAWVKFTHTFVAATDTIFCPVVLSTDVKHDASIATVAVATQRPGGTNGATSICVRWQHSMDNANWQEYTLGTDSTTWATAASDTVGNGLAALYGRTKHLASVPITQATHAGWFPYNRVLIFGQSTNTIGTKLDLHVIEQ